MPGEIWTLIHWSLLEGIESMAACIVWNTPAGPDLPTVMVDLIIFSFLQSTALETLEEAIKMKKINIGRSFILVKYCLEDASSSLCHNMLQQTLHRRN